MTPVAKLTIGFASVAALIAAATGWWTVRTYRDSLQATVIAAAERSADLIQRSARRDMLTNSREDLDFLVRTLGGQSGAGRVRIGGPEGRVVYSSAPNEISTHIVSSGEHVRFFKANGAPALGVTRLIRNEYECWNAACHAHPASQQVLGVLDVQMPLEAVEASAASFERKSLGLGALGVLLIAGLAWPMIRMQLALARKESDRWTRELELRVEQKAAELDRAYRQASSVEKMASLGKLSAALAHEINNPLAGIRTYARWMSRTMPAAAASDPRAPEWRKALGVIEDESKRCGDLVRNLLTFARQTPLQMASADIGEIVERCLLLVRHQAAMQNVEIQWTPLGTAQETPLTVVCDAAQVQQALLAIVINGIEVMPHGGILRIGVARKGKELLITIADSGPGVAAETLPHLFEPFYTTKLEGKGTGLGLSLAHGIVTRHEGRIEVGSGRTEAGLVRGAQFTVVLPVGGVETTCQKSEEISEEISSLSTTKP